MSLFLVVGMSATPAIGQEPGDATGDGRFGDDDVQAVIDEILELEMAPGDPNCNADGFVDVLDVVCLRNFVWLEAISPSSAPVGSGDLSLGVDGWGFRDGAVVRFDGAELETTFVDETRVDATVPAAQLSEAGAFAVQVANSNGYASSAEIFTVDADLALTGLSPGGVAAGSPDFTLTLSGTGFQNGAFARANDVPIATTFVGSGMLTATVPASFVAAPGTVAMTVENPDGALSEALSLIVDTLSISDVQPTSGPIGTLVTIAGSGLDLPPRVTFAAQTGARIDAPLLTASESMMQVQVPTGAATGSIELISGALVLTGPTFTVTTSRSFDLTAGPAAATLLQGGSISYSIFANSADGFDGLVSLSASGVPAGLTATFSPQRIKPGTFSILELTAPPDQPLGKIPFTVAGSAQIEGQTVVDTIELSVDVQPVTTTFMGRTVSADPVPVPLQGVNVRFLGVDDQGDDTGCEPPLVPAVSTDLAGNYVFSNLPVECTGPQLVGYDGLTVTNPPGRQYAGVNLRWEILAGEINVAEPLTHLIRIDSAERVEIEQNSGITQRFTFETIPGLRIEVYPGTIFELANGDTPNPFPLIAARVPTDRLPDDMGLGDGEMMPFIVAFQPANAVASQPVAVDYPNLVGTPPTTVVDLFTLDPTQGVMVDYGDGTVSDDASSIVANEDPDTPEGQRYGITHFDWHGPVTPLPPPGNTAPTGSERGCKLTGTGAAGGGCSCVARSGGNSVELATGIEDHRVLESAITGIVLPVAFERIYRSDFTGFDGPFGLGTNHSLAYTLLAGADTSETLVELSLPNGRRLSFVRQDDGSYSSDSAFASSTRLVWNGSDAYELTTIDGSVLTFTPGPFGDERSALSGITDLHGNRVDLVLVTGADNEQILERIVAPNGEEILFTYDAANRILEIEQPGGRETDFLYDGSGRLVSVTDPAGGVTAYNWDGSDRLETITDPRGITLVTKEYDAQHRVVRETFPDGGETTYDYTLANPDDPESPVVLTEVTDPLGRSTTLRFDVEGRLTDVTDPLGQTVVFTIDPESGLYVAREGAADCALCGDTSGGDFTVQYDGLGRVTKLTDALGNSTDLTYPATGLFPDSITDALDRPILLGIGTEGQLESVEDPAGNVWALSYDAQGRLVGVTDPNLDTTDFSYGPLGRLESVTDPLGNTTLLEYDATGRVSVIHRADGTTERLSYDPAGRLIRAEDPRGEVASLEYDAAGLPTALTDFLGRVTRFEYDDLGRLDLQVDPLGGETSITYDLAGNVTSVVRPSGDSVTALYDAAHRPVDLTWSGGARLLLEWTPRGLLGAADDLLGGRVERTYDAVGQLETELSPAGSFSYVYDEIGRRTDRVGADGTVTWGYDTAGNLDSITSAAASVTFDHDGEGRLLQALLPHGVTVDYAWDAADRLTRIDYAGPGGYSDFRAYTYDAVRRVTSVAAESLDPPLPSPQFVSFDDANRIVELNGREFVYHDDGMLLEDGLTTFTWNDLGRLISATGPEGSVSYRYDALGRWLEKTETGVTATFLQDGFNVARTTMAGRSEDHLQGPFLDETWVSSPSGDEPAAVIRDRLNNVIGLVKPSGLAEIANYDEYGTARFSDPGAFTFGFAGRPVETGSLVSMRTRFYNPERGRFISEDPIGFSGLDLNLYRYALNSPATLVDPTGLLSIEAKENARRSIRTLVRVVQVGVVVGAAGIAILSGSGVVAFLAGVSTFGIVKMLDAAGSVAEGLFVDVVPSILEQDPQQWDQGGEKLGEGGGIPDFLFDVTRDGPSTCGGICD